MTNFMDNARALLARLMEEDDDSSSDEEGSSRVQPRSQPQQPQQRPVSLQFVDLTASDDARDEEEEEDARRAVRGSGGQGGTDTDEDKDDDEASGDVNSMTSASGIGTRFRGIIVDDDDSDVESDDGDDDDGDGSDVVLAEPPSTTDLTAETPDNTSRIGRKRSRCEMAASQETSSNDVVVVETKVVLKPQPTECTICIDVCTISGPHRLVALKCGHLFGKMCIERWVLTRKACPICNLAVRKPDIRALFSDHVAVVDNSGLTEMTEKYEAEKAKRIQVRLSVACPVFDDGPTTTHIAILSLSLFFRYAVGGDARADKAAAAGRDPDPPTGSAAVERGAQWLPGQSKREAVAASKVAASMEIVAFVRRKMRESELDEDGASTVVESDESEAEYLLPPPAPVPQPAPLLSSPQQQPAQQQVVDLAASGEETQEIETEDDEPLAASIASIARSAAGSSTTSNSNVNGSGQRGASLQTTTGGGGDSSDGAELVLVEAPPRNPVTAQYIKKSRKRLRNEAATATAVAAAAAQKPTVVVKAQPTECTICYDACMISGRHRLVALKCGHLFGKKCIERWVLERKSCPNCNVAVKKADIRPLFSDHVAVVDNSGVEGMKQMYEDEKSKRIQVETELSRTKLQMEIVAAESTRHKEEALRWRKEFTQLQCRVASERFTSSAAGAGGSAVELSQQPSQSQSQQSQQSQWGQAPVSGSGWSPDRPAYPMSSGGGGFLIEQASPGGGHSTVASSFSSSSSSSSSWNYKEVYRYPLKNSRVFDIARSCFMVCVGEEMSTTKFGILKMSAVDPRHSVLIAGHQSPVRDLKINRKEDLVVTVAFDGKLVVSNLNSQSVVLQCPLPPGKRQGWSCAFSDVDPFALYCGFHDGSIAKYDMRKPISEAVVATFSAQEKQPVHSIRLFKAPDGKERLVAVTFSGISIWNDCNNASSSISDTDTSFLSRAADSRAPVASCCSLGSVQTRPASVLVSSRTLPSAPAKHSVFDLTQALASGVSPSPRSVVTGHRTPPVLARSAVWEAQDGSTIVASGDDESKQVLLWDAATNQVRHRFRPFPGNQVVIDVQHAVAHGTWNNRKALFGALSSQQFVLYSS